MAEKSVGYVPGEDPRTIEANLKHQEALDLLTSSLDARKNRFFDPVMLAAAEGFLSPTQTGSFGESLGKAAGKIGAAEAEAAKENQLIAQQRVAATTQGLELQRQRAADDAMTEFLNKRKLGAPGLAVPPAVGALPTTEPKIGALTAANAAPVAAAPLSTQPVAGTPKPVAAPVATSGLSTINQEVAPQPPLRSTATPAPVAAPIAAPGALTQAAAKPLPDYAGVPGIQIMPPNPNFMSAEDYIALNRFDKTKSRADILKEAQEMEQKRLQVKESGTTDLATGMFYPSATGKTEKVQIYGKPGQTYDVDATTAARLSYYAQTDPEKYYQLADLIVKGPARPGAKQEDLMSSEERARQQKIADANTELEIQSRKQFYEKREMANDTITNANVMRKFASEPNANKMVGILSNSNLSSGLATLIKEGIGMPGFSINLPSIEKIMVNAGLNREDQAKYRVFLMNAAQMQLAAEKYLKGATSERERTLLAEASINAQDTPETIRIKADILTKRAQFDRQIYREFKKSKMTADEFLDSDAYNEIRDKYNSDLDKISIGEAKLVTREESKKGSGLPSSDLGAGFFRDSDGVIRRKK